MLKKFLRLAVPMVISCNFSVMIGLANTVFAGRFNDAAKLAGVGLGCSTTWILCMSLVLGLNGALETLVS